MLQVACGRPALDTPRLPLFLLFAIVFRCSGRFLAVGFFSFFFV